MAWLRAALILQLPDNEQYEYVNSYEVGCKMQWEKNPPVRFLRH